MNITKTKKRICIIIMAVLFSINAAMSLIMIKDVYAKNTVIKGELSANYVIKAVSGQISENDAGYTQKDICISDNSARCLSDKAMLAARDIVRKVEFEKINRVGTVCEAVKLKLIVSDNFVPRKDGNFAFSLNTRLGDDSDINYSDEREITVSENGTLYLRIRDDSGDRVVKEIMIDGIDKEAPLIGEIKALPDGMKNGYAKEAVLCVEASDDGCGIADEGYAIAGPFEDEKSREYDYKWQSEQMFTISQNGIYRFFVRDKYGNRSCAVSEVSFIDTAGPDFYELKYSFENEKNGFGKSVTISPVISDKCSLAAAAYSFDGGKSFNAVSSNTYYENGRVELVFRDALNNESRKSVDITCIDREGPEAFVMPTAQQFVNGYARKLTLSVNAADKGCGLPDKPYSDNRIDYYRSNEFAAYENGTYRLFVRDLLGNETALKYEITCIDNEAPSVKGTQLILDSPKNGYASSGQFFVEADDAKSGLAERAYSFDDGITYVSSNSISVNKGGLFTVRVKDALNNESRFVTELKTIDSEAPEIIITGNPSSTVNTDVTLTLAVSDKKSGLESIWYCNDSVKTKTLIGEFYGEKSAKKKVTITKNGNYSFYVYDELGNEAVSKISVSKIDRSYRDESDSSSSSTSSSARPYGDEARQSESKKSIVIGESKQLSTSSETVVNRDIIIPDEGEEWEEIEDEDTGEGGYVFVGLSENAAPDEYMEMTEHYEGTYDEALSQRDARTTEIEYPKAKKQGSDVGAMAGIVASIMVLCLVILVAFILFKLGIIKLPEKIKNKSGDSKALDIQDEE